MASFEQLSGNADWMKWQAAVAAQNPMPTPGSAPSVASAWNPQPKPVAVFGGTPTPAAQMQNAFSGVSQGITQFPAGNAGMLSQYNTPSASFGGAATAPAPAGPPRDKPSVIRDGPIEFSSLAGDGNYYLDDARIDANGNYLSGPSGTRAQTDAEYLAGGGRVLGDNGLSYPASALVNGRIPPGTPGGQLPVSDTNPQGGGAPPPGYQYNGWDVNNFNPNHPDRPNDGSVTFPMPDDRMPGQTPRPSGGGSGGGGGAVFGGSGGGSGGGGGAASGSSSTTTSGGQTDREVVKEEETIEGRIGALMGQDAQGNYTNPLIRQAAENAMQQMSGRGLLNSSMALEAATQAAISKAIEIAGPDAQTYFSQGRANQDVRNVFERDKRQFAQDDKVQDKKFAQDDYMLDKQQSHDLVRLEKELQARLDVANLDVDSRREAEERGRKHAAAMADSDAAAAKYDLTLRRISEIDNNKDLDADAKAKLKSETWKDYEYFMRQRGLVYEAFEGDRYSTKKPDDKKPDDKKPDTGGGSSGGSGSGTPTNDYGN